MKFNVSVYNFFSCMKNIFTLQLISDYHYFLVLFTVFVMNYIVKMKSAIVVLILIFLLLHNNNNNVLLL